MPKIELPMLTENIDWTDPRAHISEHFTIREALTLHKWGNALHRPTSAEKAAILQTATKMEMIRSFLGDRSITVTSWLRPPVANIPGNERQGQDYNAFIKGAKNSDHRLGLACDFEVKGLTPDEVRKALLPKLEEFKIRMEDLAGASWIHIDVQESLLPGAKRFFKP